MPGSGGSGDSNARLSAEQIEGMLVAHRKALALLLARAPRQAGVASPADSLDAWREQLDHQEDPGATPDPEFAVQAATALELRLLAESVRRHLGEPQP